MIPSNGHFIFAGANGGEEQTLHIVNTMILIAGEKA